MTRSREVALCALAGLALAGLLSIRIAAPWRFVHDDNGACFQAIATAHLRAGLARTHGQDFWIRRSDGQLVPYLHHPPLLGLTLAAAYRLTGRSDPFVTRLVPALFHLLGFVGFCVLARSVFTDAAPRVLAAFVYALVPMSAFFGKMPDHEPIGLCWVMWGMAAVAALCVRPARLSHPGAAPRPVARGWWLGVGACAWFMAGLTAWAAYAVLIGVGGILALEARAPLSRRALVVLVIAGLVSLAVMLTLLAWAGGPVRGLQTVGFWASALREPRQIPHSMGRILGSNRIYFANLPSMAFLVWSVLAVRDESRGRGESGSVKRLLLGATAGCGLWLVAFMRAAEIHAYQQFWLLPFVALATADMSVRTWGALAHRSSLRAVLAALAAAIVLGSTAVTLYHRYTRPGAYAVRASAWFQATYESEP